jgi:hypothetical protein
MTEIWLPVKGFENTHVVSNLGNVRSIYREYNGLTPTGLPCKFHVAGKLLGTHIGNTGYLRVALVVGGHLKTASVHRLVAMAFVPNPCGRPQVNHIDGVKTNNVPENLEWCTESHNQHHAIRLGLISHPLGDKRAFAKLTDNNVREIRAQIADGRNQREIAKAFGVCPSKITFIKQGRAWKHVA